MSTTRSVTLPTQYLVAYRRHIQENQLGLNKYMVYQCNKQGNEDIKKHVTVCICLNQCEVCVYTILVC